MRYCYPRKKYYVSTRWRRYPDGGGRDYVATASLGRARYYAKKLKLKYRQIDVRVWGKPPYVLQGSWL